MQSRIQDSLAPHVVYENNISLPDTTYIEEMITKKQKLEISAKRQAMIIVNYENQKTLSTQDKEDRITLPCFSTLPPIICSNGKYYRFSIVEWNDAIEEAKQQYQEELLRER